MEEHQVPNNHTKIESINKLTNHMHKISKYKLEAYLQKSKMYFYNKQAKKSYTILVRILAQEKP